MSSNIEVQKICLHCGKEFTARKTTTKYCSHNCARQEYKRNARNEKIEAVKRETLERKNPDLVNVKERPFLTVKQAATLLNSTPKTIYRIIQRGELNAINLGQRKTLIRREDIERLFERPEKPNSRELEPVAFEKENFWTVGQIQDLFGISETALYHLALREGLTKVSRPPFVYIPKKEIVKIFGTPKGD